MEFLRSLLNKPWFYVYLMIYLFITYFFFGTINPFLIVMSFFKRREINRKIEEKMKERDAMKEQENSSFMDYFDEFTDFFIT